jgi:hypothetical protein
MLLLYSNSVHILFFPTGNTVLAQLDEASKKEPVKAVEAKVEAKVGLILLLFVHVILRVPFLALN